MMTEIGGEVPYFETAWITGISIDINDQ